MHRVPAQPQRQRVSAQPARVEEPEQLDLGEVRRAQGAELLGAVLAEVPGVGGLAAPGPREGEQVGSGDIDRAPRPHQRA